MNHYIVLWPMVVITAMMLLMMMTIRLLSNAAIEYDIKNDLRKSVNQSLKYISFEKDGLKIEDEFWYIQDCTFVILRTDGTVEAGSYPEKLKEKIKELEVPERLTVSVTSGTEKYYVRDVLIGREHTKWKYYVRGIIKKSDADSHYATIAMVSYLNIICVLDAILVWGLFYSKRVSRALDDMCKTAESIGTSFDITKRMTENYKFQEVEVLAQANNRMLDRIEQNFQQQKQFTSDVAHELRTPIAVVLAQCQYARERMLSVEEHEEILDVIFRQSKKIDSLIIQLLHLSRLDQDRIEIQDETLDLVEIVQSVCEEWQEKLQNGIRIRLNLEEAYSMGDIGLIVIVIQNLLTNAVKFSRPYGVIDIKTGEASGESYVQVTDYGIGIAKEHQEQIFQRFYKCDKSRNAEGFGLGLALSKKIVEKHGGRITVLSELGKGSTFTLYLPVQKKIPSEIF